MRHRSITYPLVALGAVAATMTVASPASAHGYVSSPPSRQALCASGAVANCGAIQFEPQSVEGVKGLKNCHGGLAPFAILNDNSRNWPAKAVGTSVTFTWTKTARHRTSNWEYFIGDKKIATVDGGNAQPEAIVNHTINLSGFQGRQTVLAVWNIGDTPMAFYNCVDLQIGGGGTSNPPPATTPPATRPPAQQPTQPPAQQPTQPPATTAPPAGGGNQGGGNQGGGAAGDWKAGVAYKAGDEVTFQGKKYQCRQAHSSLNSWEPSVFTLALWLPL